MVECWRSKAALTAMKAERQNELKWFSVQPKAVEKESCNSSKDLHLKLEKEEAMHVVGRPTIPNTE